MKINKLISSIIVGSALLAAGTVNAATISGDIVQISTNGAIVTVWVRPTNFSAVPTYVWSVTTNNLVIAASIGSGINKSAQLTTSAACAGTGSIRSCGTITSVRIN
jgi:hypothetical protein